MRRATLALSSLLSLALLFTLSSTALASSEDDRYADDDGYEETARVARVSLIRGDVSVRRAGDDKWERAALNLPLVEGDRLATGADSHLEIQIDARNFLRVGPYATLDIVTLRDEGVALSLPEGTATLRLARFDGGREYFEIDAPGTTVAAERTGLYRLDVTNEGRVRVTVRDDGRARIYSENSGFTLRNNARPNSSDSAARTRPTGTFPTQLPSTLGTLGLTTAKGIWPSACATKGASATTTARCGARKNSTPTATGFLIKTTATSGVRA